MAIPKITVDVEMLDGNTYEDLRVIGADLIKHADVAKRHKWGSIEDDPMRAQFFLGYAAMTRTGNYDRNKGFDEFIEDVAMVAGDFGDDAVDPTN